MIKETIIRDKKGNIIEIIQEGDVDEYIAYDEMVEGDYED